MKRSLIAPARRRGERGQTLVLVALSLFSLLAMAALAIDVVTLYTARTEVQRAADAAALAGAKAFVDSGVTTDPDNLTRQGLAQSMANSIIGTLLAQNKVGGSPPVLVGTPIFDFSTARKGNPQITVTLQRTGLPIFFARIWSQALASVTASSTAEAYNPSNSQVNTGNLVPITPKCVKPFLVSNQDPGNSGDQFVRPLDGTLVHANTVVGEQIVFRSGCAAGPVACSPNPTPPPGTYYLTQVTPNPANLCPSCQGTTELEQSIECCDANAYACGGVLPMAKMDLIVTGDQGRQDTTNGLQCLMHSPPDFIDRANYLAATGPAEIRAGTGPKAGQLVSTSNSIVTIPIFDSLNPATGDATVVGFLQAFVENVNPGDPSEPITVTVLNVAGCGQSPSGSPVAGGGVSPIPVRLIHN